MARTQNNAAAAISAALARIRIVLVDTTHPGNIGAVARAMKTMGMRRLCLVNPRNFPSAEATARASGADDVLMAAQVCTSLSAAIADCALVYGTSARTRYLEWPCVTPREAASTLVTMAAHTETAIVFGREQSGLSNQELERCHGAIRIPTDERFSSLNLAQAVQICVYELRLAALAAAAAGTEQTPATEPLATATELEALLDHWLEGMHEVDYYDPSKPKLLPRRVWRMLNKAGLLHSEVQILRGFLTAIRRAVRER